MERFHTDYAGDTPFGAHARLQQSRWRDSRGYPRIKDYYGNYIDKDYAKSTGANFLTDNIFALIKQEVGKAPERGALIGEPRIWNNMLSSQPLCFNMFGELYYDLDLASLFFRKAFPGKVDKVTAIKFEHSPGRGDNKYTGDRSAFDVFAEYSRGVVRGFIGIEVKYAETLREESLATAEKRHRERYDEVSAASGIFKPESIGLLRKPPVSQIWRDHLLAISLRQDYDEGSFVFLYPALNSHCENGVNEYRALLTSDSEDMTGFLPRHLEEFVRILEEVSCAGWVKDLRDRYIIKKF